MALVVPVALVPPVVSVPCMPPITLPVPPFLFNVIVTVLPRHIMPQLALPVFDDAAGIEPLVGDAFCFVVPVGQLAARTREYPRFPRYVAVCVVPVPIATES
ncbi:MAG: hypothetical protein FWG39_00190 [Alphaproteobacteria bacterium]|nr:hypothetical protein [Alphaproteobacteria bacterium]